MNILHTSDWHLGQSLYGRRRHDEFRLFLDWLADTLRREAVDVLLVPGDIFDSGLPSNQAQALYYGFLCEAAKGPCRHVVITAGNHDSPSFLDAPQPLLQALNVHVVGHARTPEEEVLLLRDSEGRPELIVCAVPFLRDRDLFRASPGDTVDDRDALLAAGMAEHYRRCAERAEQLRAEAASASPGAPALPALPTLPVVAMGHLFAAGGIVDEDDGVRDIRVGSLGQVHADIFPESFDYVALGHLHRAQKVNGREHIRYSGSPLPMGFGEAAQQKKVCLVTCEGRSVSVRQLDIPLFQKLEKLSGDLPELEAGLAELSLRGEPVWVEVLFTGPGVASDLRERLLEKAASHVEILRVRSSHGLSATFAEGGDSLTLEDMSIHDVFERRLDDLEREAGLEEEQRRALRETYAEAVRDFQQSKEEDAPCAS